MNPLINLIQRLTHLESCTSMIQTMVQLNDVVYIGPVWRDYLLQNGGILFVSSLNVANFYGLRNCPRLPMVFDQVPLATILNFGYLYPDNQIYVVVCPEERYMLESILSLYRAHRELEQQLTLTTLTPTIPTVVNPPEASSENITPSTSKDDETSKKRIKKEREDEFSLLGFLAGDDSIANELFEDYVETELKTKRIKK